MDLKALMQTLEKIDKKQILNESVETIHYEETAEAEEFITEGVSDLKCSIARA